VLYYLNAAGITIVQILAVAVFVSLLLVIGLASEVDDLLKKYQARIKRGTLWRDFWFYTLIWIVLLVWGAKELFM
jgi:magnesium-transporting ATPase (P-type)